MAISVADNFSYKGAKPLDARFQFSSVANMKTEPVANLYDGCLAYVTATKKYYTYDSSNTSTEETGKWRELQTGGGGGSDTDYSTTEKIVGTWIDGKPLYQKTVEATVPSTSTGTMATGSTDISDLNIDTIIKMTGIGYFISNDYRYDFIFDPCSVSKKSSTIYVIKLLYDNTHGHLLLQTDDSVLSDKTYKVTIQYTKTTD